MTGVAVPTPTGLQPAAAFEAAVEDEADERHGRDHDRIAEIRPELRHVLFGMLERAKDTGDPLGYRAGMIDLDRLVNNVVALSMPSAQNRGIRLKSVAQFLSSCQEINAYFSKRWTR